MTMLTEEERVRYARQIALPQFGEEGQMRLKEGSVLIIGAGGLGSPVAMYLAAAGVGRIGLVDGDNADLTNLQRQIIHTTADVGRPKVISAAEKLTAINPDITIEPHNRFVNADNIHDLISNYDFVIDATDNFDIKLLVNDACVEAGKAYCHGAIWRYEGQLTTVTPGSACYRCLFSSVPSKEQAKGPIGVLPGVIGTLQATEAVKYLSGIGKLLTGKLLRFDSLTMQFTTISFGISPDCPHHSHKHNQ